jgi:hypothetical protein
MAHNQQEESEMGKEAPEASNAKAKRNSNKTTTFLYKLRITC